MKIAILTSPNEWFQPYAEKLSIKLGNIPIFYSHETIDSNFHILFILGYHRIIDQNVLNKNNHNVVIHESDLPKGKGFAPLFWQILEGNNSIVFSMFEAIEGFDNGPIYMKRELKLSGLELNEELRMKQANLTMEMCVDFASNIKSFLPPTTQVGKETFYSRRKCIDSKLNIDSTLKEQFNLLRIVNNDKYPAFFEINGEKYIIKIEKERKI